MEPDHLLETARPVETLFFETSGLPYGVPIVSAEDTQMARQAAMLAAEVLAMIETYFVPGVSTEVLDRICRDYIINV